MISDDDDDVRIWCDRLRPDESSLVSEFLSDDTDESRYSDTIASHHDLPCFPIFILIFKSKCIRETGSELKDISDFGDDFLHILSMSTFSTGEFLRIDDFEIMCLPTFFTYIDLIFSDLELCLELIGVLRKVSSRSKSIVSRVSQSNSLEHTIIYTMHHLEILIELFLTTMERVRILHEKFSTTEES
jgi:hypothetical protein